MGSRFVLLTASALAAATLSSCSPTGPVTGSSTSAGPAAETLREADVERLSVEIVDIHPFDETSFTQGLEVDEDGALLVGTGQRGESRVYRSTLEGEKLASADLAPEFFGEGLTRVGDHLWQLTWQSGVAFRRDADTLEETGRVDYPGEGWGLCARGDELIMSDGTDQLRRLDAETFAERDRFRVTLGGEPVQGVNELECVGDEVYANVFLSTDILRIDAATGAVTGVIDASTLPNNATPDPDHVLNGIAHVPGTGRFLLGGKRWPDLYEVELVPAG
ncbi:glutaminyl-peptide cyclotransferase [Corynebacterium halotolerans]|uniref:Glutamine cyclotransferase n=1 Tax=Corynebacterium halotolerans YIM 70093 = DSM 44683 TaxID=1121362 RepID=M1NWF4_9CORY|nr:glutaminyl-peptide cyclotransferase [Corynebacterium halotolerans]AGF71825.1 glutamine cyclotransferase [Corynebacterium halotolerans YIM 70093 = DSM 44683]